MAQKPIYIWWDEFDRRDLPRVCLHCADKARWVRCTFEMTTRIGHDKLHRKRKVEIPFCDDHEVSALTAQFNDKGVWLEDADEDFVAALKKHRKAEIAAWKKEMDDPDPANYEDEQLPPGLRKASEPPPKQTAKPFLIILAVFLVILLLPGCLAAGAVAFFFLRPQ